MKRIRNHLRNYPHYYIAIVILTILLLLSLAAPLFPLDPNHIDVSKINQGPSSEHIFGTDELGRDYFIRVFYGGRVSLLVGTLAMVTSTTIGVVVGLLSGYFGGIVDSILMRVVDVLSSIPWLVLVIVISVFLQPGLQTIVIVIGGFSWMGIARLVRAETMSLKERDYVTYAKFIKRKSRSIILEHILPGTVPTIIVAATGSIASAIMTESTLSFLGLGVQPPSASWGSLLRLAQSNLQTAPHMAIIPGLFIMLTVYSFNSLGNLVNQVYNKDDFNE